MGVVSTGEEVADSNSGTTKTTEPCHLLRVNVKKARGLAMLLERSFSGTTPRKIRGELLFSDFVDYATTIVCVFGLEPSRRAAPPSILLSNPPASRQAQPQSYNLSRLSSAQSSSGE